MGNPELVLAYDAAPDFIGPPVAPLRLVTEQPPARSVERQALADIVGSIAALGDAIAKLETQCRAAALNVAAAQAAKDVADLEHADARRIAAEDVLAILKAEPPRGMVVSGFKVSTVQADGVRLSGVGATTAGMVEAREAVAACADMLEAATEAQKIIARQLAEAQRQMTKMILVRRDAVWAVVRADPIVARIRQVHADTGALLAMLQSMHCHPGGPEPEARPEVTAAWVGFLNELMSKPDLPLPGMPEIREG